MKKLLKYIVITLFFSNSYAAYFDSITVFGGSYADVGMGYIISTAGPPNSPIPPSPPYFQGKFSDGPIYLEYLPKLIDANYPLLSMAVGGSTTGTANAEDVNNVRGLGGVATQIQRFQNTFQFINPKSLTILEAGFDNFILLNEEGKLSDPVQVIQGIATAISELKSDVKGIKQLGAHQIVLYTLPDPKTIPVFKEDPANLPVLEVIADTINHSLKEMAKTQNEDVFIYDFYHIVDDVLAEYAAAGGNINDHTLTIVSVDPYVVVQNGPNPANLAYWDGIHLTTQIQSILAKYLASVLNAPRSIGAQMDLAFLSTETQNDILETRLSNITKRLLCSCPSSQCCYNGFFDIGGKWGHKDSKSRDFGFEFNEYHISAGIDNCFTDCLSAGLLTSWIRTHGDFNRGNGHIVLQDWATSLYGTYFMSSWGFDSQCTFHYYHFDNDRKKLVFNRKAKADIDGYGPEIGLKASYYMNMDCLIFAPFIAADYNYVNLNSYHEHGAGLLDLKMGHQWDNSLLGKIGLRMFTVDCAWYNLDFQLGYEHEFLRNERDQIHPLFFDIENNKYIYKRNGPDRDFIRFLARGDLTYWDNLIFTFEYIGFYGLNKKSQYNNSVQLEATLDF